MDNLTFLLHCFCVLNVGQIKTVFVGLYYSAIVPTGLIVTAIAMMNLYWVDKYCLLRQWRRPPVSHPPKCSIFLRVVCEVSDICLFSCTFLVVYLINCVPFLSVPSLYCTLLVIFLYSGVPY